MIRGDENKFFNYLIFCSSRFNEEAYGMPVFDLFNNFCFLF